MSKNSDSSLPSTSERATLDECGIGIRDADALPRSRDGGGAVAPCDDQKFVNEEGKPTLAPVPVVPNRRNRAMSWLLFSTIFAMVAWVIAYTLVADHDTDIVRKYIYPDLESKYFVDKNNADSPRNKDGARAFTYLGVFYILAGTVTLLCVGRGVHLPKPKPWMVRSFKMPLFKEYYTYLDLCAVLGFLAFEICQMGILISVEWKPWDEWTPAKRCHEVCKMLGKTAAITMLFLLLPISKSCFWWDLFNMKFERAIKFHKFLAWWLVVVIILHTGLGVASFAIEGEFMVCMWPNEECLAAEKGLFHLLSPAESLWLSRMMTYGWAGVLALLTIAVTSLPWFRRRKFEWFYYAHFMFIPFLMLFQAHWPPVIFFMGPGLSAYILDKVLWWCSSRRPVKLLSMTQPAPKVVRLTLALEPGHSYLPGQFVKIKIPAVSFWQWHPMSVSSAPSKSSITFDIKVLGDWTAGIERLAERFDPGRYAHTCIFLDRFHGSSHTLGQGYLSHPAVLMFAGGIGITPMMSALRELVQDGTGIPAVRRVVLVWVVRREPLIDLYRHELAKLQTLGKTDNGVEVEVLVHATLSKKEDPAIPEVPLPMEFKEPKHALSKAPFMQHLMGHGHLLFLTIGAGGGYLLGVFAANVWAYDQPEWRTAWVGLLQLCMAVLFCGAIVAVGISDSFFRPPSNHECTESLLEKPSPCTEEMEEEGRPKLNAVLGSRPNVDDIMGDMKKWCDEHGCTSVGVAVCGPEALVKEVHKTSVKATRKDLPFVVDDESFEW